MARTDCPSFFKYNNHIKSSFLFPLLVVDGEDMKLLQSRGWEFTLASFVGAVFRFTPMLHMAPHPFQFIVYAHTTKEKKTIWWPPY